MNVTPSLMSLRTRGLLFAPALIVFGYTVWQSADELTAHTALTPRLLELVLVTLVCCTIATFQRLPSALPATVMLITMRSVLSLGVIDDAYISLRYARNFAQGHGLVFNIGERVEGYTCFLWVWLLGLLNKLSSGFDLVVTSQVLGMLASVGALIVTQRSARMLASQSEARVWDGGTLMLLAGHFPLVFWAFSGMETGLCLLLMSGGTLCMCRFLQQDEGARGSLLGASLLWVGAMLTRPELYLLYAGHLPFVLWRRWRRPWPALLAFGLPCLLLFVPYFAWRYQYYGYAFPNTYYAKVGTPFSQLRFGSNYLCLGLVPHALLIPFVARRLLRLDRTRPAELYIAAMIGLLCAAILITGADHFTEWRYFCYLLPFLYMLAYEDLLNALAVSAAVPSGLQWPLRSLSLSAVCGVFFASVFCFQDVGIRSSLWYGANEAGPLRDLGLYLKQNTSQDAVLASPMIGALGYYSERVLIDMVGLTDVHIAHKQVDPDGPKDHARFDSEYLMGRKPDWIYLSTSAPDEARFLKTRTWIPAVQDLKRYFPNHDYRYEVLVVPTGRHPLYVRTSQRNSGLARR